MNLHILTCTEGRPQLLSLCRQWVMRARPSSWTVNNPISSESVQALEGIPTRRTYHCGETNGVRRAVSALAKTLIWAAPREGLVVIMEDDDWYPPNYAANMLAAARQEATAGSRVFGAIADIRYNLPAKRYMGVSYHDQPPAAGAIAIRGEHTELYGRILASELLRDPIGADHRAFQYFNEMGQATIVLNTSRVSIKGAGYGLPGTPGATAKHDPDTLKVQGWAQDTDNYGFLRYTLGPDAEEYIRLCSR